MTVPDAASDTAALSSTLQWHCLPFGEIPALTLYGVLALRSEVFVVEQRCIYQDPDGRDLDALLVVGTQALPAPGAAPEPVQPSRVVATARLLAPGVRFDEPSVGRVCTSPFHRRRGLGRALMEFSIAKVREHHPDAGIRLSAQAYLQRFYESLGFAVVSPPYLEDAIPHLEMRLAPG